MVAAIRSSYENQQRKTNLSDSIIYAECSAYKEFRRQLRRASGFTAGDEANGPALRYLAPVFRSISSSRFLALQRRRTLRRGEAKTIDGNDRLSNGM